MHVCNTRHAMHLQTHSPPLQLTCIHLVAAAIMMVVIALQMQSIMQKRLHNTPVTFTAPVNSLTLSCMLTLCDVDLLAYYCGYLLARLHSYLHTHSIRCRDPGNMSLAENTYQVVLRLDPDNASSRKGLKRIKLMNNSKNAGNEAFKAGKWREAEQHYTQALELDSHLKSSFVAQCACNRLAPNLLPLHALLACTLNA